MKIHHILCPEDSYAYLIIDDSTKEAAAVDPVEPEKVVDFVQELGASIKLVLTTHHHQYHAGGNEKIRQLIPGIKVYGGSVDNVKGCTDVVENGDKIALGEDISILAIHTPCHTKGHISYYVTAMEGEDPAVFTGDTLVQQKLSRARDQRQKGLPTVPSTIGEELETNPFMRADLPEVQERVGCNSPVEALGEIRRRKDEWTK